MLTHIQSGSYLCLPIEGHREKKKPTAFSMDEGNAISTNEGLSKLYIVYKLKEISLRINRFYKTDVCFHRLRSPHPSARLYLIKYYSFSCSHPPSPQWEGLC